jgi:hypothetical protein
MQATALPLRFSAAPDARRQACADRSVTDVGMKQNQFELHKIKEYATLHPVGHDLNYSFSLNPSKEKSWHKLLLSAEKQSYNGWKNP